MKLSIRRAFTIVCTPGRVFIDVTFLRLTAITPICCLLLSACATTRPGPNSSAEVQAFVSQVKPGDFVKCEMRSGSTRAFTVVEVKSGWLIGKETSAYAGDIVTVGITPKFIKQRNDALDAGVALTAIDLGLRALGH